MISKELVYECKPAYKGFFGHCLECTCLFDKTGLLMNQENKKITQSREKSPKSMYHIKLLITVANFFLLMW